MYAQTTRFTPALGKVPELRAVLEDRVKSGQARGLRMNLTQAVFAGPAGTNYRTDITFPDLGAYEAYRQQNQADEGFQAFQARAAALVSAPPDVRLTEVLVPYPATAVMPAGYFFQVNYLFPAVGAGPELRALLEEAVKEAQANGRLEALRAGVFGYDGPVYIRLFRYQTLAELEANRSRTAASPNTQFTARRDRLLRQPVQAELRQSLIAAPAPR
jgi:hypothetical protein